MRMKVGFDMDLDSSDCRVKWSAYLQEFTFNIRHKAGKDNMVADALRRRKHLLTTMTLTVPGFEQLKQDHADD